MDPKKYFRDKKVQTKYALCIENRRTGTSDYIGKYMSEKEVAKYIERNKTKLEDCTIIGMPNNRITADDSGYVCFKESEYKALASEEKVSYKANKPITEKHLISGADQKKIIEPKKQPKRVSLTKCIALDEMKKLKL